MTQARTGDQMSEFRRPMKNIISVWFIFIYIELNPDKNMFNQWAAPVIIHVSAANQQQYLFLKLLKVNGSFTVNAFLIKDDVCKNFYSPHKTIQ